MKNAFGSKTSDITPTILEYFYVHFGVNKNWYQEWSSLGSSYDILNVLFDVYRSFFLLHPFTLQHSTYNWSPNNIFTAQHKTVIKFLDYVSVKSKFQSYQNTSRYFQHIHPFHVIKVFYIVAKIIIKGCCKSNSIWFKVSQILSSSQTLDCWH